MWIRITKRGLLFDILSYPFAQLISEGIVYGTWDMLSIALFRGRRHAPDSDYVIVQSEAMRQVYVNVLVKYTSEDLRSHWQKKVLGLGSPKVDRACSLQREELELPEDWRRRIYREDGSRKKVIFYNTSLALAIQTGEALLDKMEWVFKAASPG